MSKKRLIPKLQMKSSERNVEKLVLVITKQFDGIIEIADPISQAKIYQHQGADELIFVNIDRQKKSVQQLAEVIAKVSEEIFMPITVGGGVKTLEDFRLLLSNGADKISINTKAIQDSNFISMAAEKYGAQCVVVSIDYKMDLATGQYFVYIDNGTVKTDIDPVDWACKCEQLGAGELLLTCIDNDGMKNGLELNISQQIAKNVSIPLIVSGGCGLAQHFSDGYLVAMADAVAAGSFFAHRDQNFMQTRSQIRNSGVEIRMYS
jgi:cyclase